MSIATLLKRLNPLRPRDTLQPAKPAIAEPSPATAPDFVEQMEESQNIALQLEKLLGHYKALAHVDGASEKVRALKALAETYYNGLSAAEEIAKNGKDWLHDLQEKTRLAADELNRFEGEGGPPATPKQAARAEELAKVARKLERVAPQIEQQFGCGHDEKDPAQQNAA